MSSLANAVSPATLRLDFRGPDRMLGLMDCRQYFQGGYALRNAARLGHLEKARELLREGVHPDMVSHQEHRFFRPWIHGRTALWHAVANNHLSMVELLLSHGANPNAVGWMSSTALWTACCTGQVEMVVRLLAAGADPNLPGCRGSSPLLAWMGTLAIPRSLEPGFARPADEGLQIGQLLNQAGASLEGVEDILEQSRQLLGRTGYDPALVDALIQPFLAERLAQALQAATSQCPDAPSIARL